MVDEHSKYHLSAHATFKYLRLRRERDEKRSVFSSSKFQNPPTKRHSTLRSGNSASHSNKHGDEKEEKGERVGMVFAKAKQKQKENENASNSKKNGKNTCH